MERDPGDGQSPEMQWFQLMC